jgi:hypothetical protein
LFFHPEEILPEKPSGNPTRRSRRCGGSRRIYGSECAVGSLLIGCDLERLGFKGRQRVRDLWRQKDLEESLEDLTVSVDPHDVQLHRIQASGR